MKKIMMLLLLLAVTTFANVSWFGAQGGQGYLSGNRYTTYNVTFNGGEQADVAISGDGSSDLDLYVYDQNGNEVCHSTSYGDDEHCVFYPRWTGPFLIKVVNEGSYGNYFSIRAF